MVNCNKFIIDFSWLYSRSKFAFKELSYEVDGTTYATGTIFGVYDAILAIIETYGRSCEIVLVMDGTPKKHQKLSNVYKAGRVKDEGGLQEKMSISRFDVAKMFTILPNVKMYWHEWMEADESIAFLVKTKKVEDVIVIMSGDGDMRQLISSDNSVYCTASYSRGSGFALEDEDVMFKSGIKGLDGLKPEAVALHLSIVGDSSDGVIGIPRFLTAVSKEISNSCINLLGLSGAVSGIDGYSEGKFKQGLVKIKENWNQVQLNWKLVNLDPLYIPEDVSYQKADMEDFVKFGCMKVYSGIQSLM